MGSTTSGNHRERRPAGQPITIAEAASRLGRTMEFVRKYPGVRTWYEGGQRMTTVEELERRGLLLPKKWRQLAREDRAEDDPREAEVAGHRQI